MSEKKCEHQVSNILEDELDLLEICQKDLEKLRKYGDSDISCVDTKVTAINPEKKIITIIKDNQKKELEYDSLVLGTA